MVNSNNVPLGDPKDMWLRRLWPLAFHLVKFDIYSLELEYVNWSNNGWIYNLMIREVILICDNTTLLNYGHQFMKSLHVVDSKSWTWASSCYLHRVLECNWFSVVRCWMNLTIGFWESSTPIGPNGPYWSSYTLMTWFMRVA